MLNKQPKQVRAVLFKLRVNQQCLRHVETLTQLQGNFDLLLGTRSQAPLYIMTIGTLLALGVWAVTFGTPCSLLFTVSNVIIMFIERN